MIVLTRVVLNFFSRGLHEPTEGYECDCGLGYKGMEALSRRESTEDHQNENQEDPR
jgi:hypothetical protein